MSTRDVFCEQELARLRGFPEITSEELIRFFTLTSADEVFLGSMRRPATMLGVAVQLCSLPWLGFVPDDVAAAPPAAVARLAERLGVSAGELAGYGGRDQTRTDHLRAVMAYRGWRGADELSVKELDEFLLARAMEHESPTLLFRLACEHLITERVLRPGPVKLLERVAAARALAERETYDRVAHLLTVSLRAELDGLLVVDRELGMTRLRWLSTGPTEASAAAVKTEVRKLEFLRGLDAHTLDLSSLPAERRRHLAAVGRRSSVPSLTRWEPHRRYPIVLTLLAQSAVDVLDEVVQLFDQAVTARESRARHKLADQLAERAKRGEDKLALAEVILPVLADPAIPDEQVGGLLRERIGMGRLAAALATPTTTRLPRDHGHLAVIEASYGYLRQFTPDVLRVLSFAGGPAAASLLEAVAVLRELNASGARTVPAGAATEFVPARWRGYLEDAAATGNTSAYRHYWELCVLLCLRDALRSGDVHVPGSRRYADPTAYLIAHEAWPAQRGEFCALVGVPVAPDAALARAQGELYTALGELDEMLGGGRDPVRLDEAGELVIGPLTAEDLPAEVAELREELTVLLPFAPIVSVFIELDRHTGLLDCFTHAGGAKLHTIMKVLGHSSVSMALVYAQISDREVLRDYKSILAPGAVIAGPAALEVKSGVLPDEAVHWLKANFFKTELELGHCLRLPAEGPCECDLYLTCAKFVTTGEYAPRLRARLDVEQVLATDAADRGWARDAERHRCTSERIEKLLTDLDQPLADPTDSLTEEP